MKILPVRGSIHDRLRVLRRARPSEIWRLVPYALMPVPRPTEPLKCELRQIEDYDSARARLSSYVGRSRAEIRPVDRKSLERLIAAARTSSGAIGVADLLFLHALVTTLAPRRVVELGTLGGFSAAVLAAAAAPQQPTADDVLVDTIDVNERCLTDKTKPVGFEIPCLVPELAARIRVHAAKDARHLDQIASKGELGFAFIDADHQHPRPTLDLLRVAPFMQPRGWVVLHDIELDRIISQMRAAGAESDYKPSRGAQWLFDAWPFPKIGGGNIGALQLPAKLRDLVPVALAMLQMPSELEGISARRTSDALLAETVRLVSARQ